MKFIMIGLILSSGILSHAATKSIHCSFKSLPLVGGYHILFNAEQLGQKEMPLQASFDGISGSEASEEKFVFQLEDESAETLTYRAPLFVDIDDIKDPSVDPDFAKAPTEYSVKMTISRTGDLISSHIAQKQFVKKKSYVDVYAGSINNYRCVQR